MVAAVRIAKSWWQKHPVLGWGLVGLVSMAAILGVGVLQAQADTVVLRPNANYNVGTWTNTGGSTHYVSVSEVTPDTTTYISNTAAGSTALFDIDDPTAAGTITSVQVTLSARERTTATTRLLHAVISDGTNTIQGAGWDVPQQNAYTLNTWTFATNPAGTAWTWSDLANLKAGCLLTTGTGTNEHRVTNIYVTVTYTPATLTVAQGTDTGANARPAAKVFVSPGTTRVVEEYVLTAATGDSTVSSVSVRGLDTASNLNTDVTSVSLYRDNGDNVYGAGDTQIDTAKTFGGALGDGSVLVTFAPAGGFVVTTTTPAKLWVVYTIGASAVDNDIVGSRIQTGDVVASSTVTVTGSPINSTNAGQTLHIDTTAPTANTSDPLTNAVLLGSSKTISGTASDTGSGVASVQLQILRSDAQYWNGTAWTATATWLSATGTTNWTYAWALDAGQNNGPLTYTITARATDGVGLVGTDATPVTGVKVDNVLPSIVSATAVDATTVDVVFSEALQAASIASTDFTIAGLTVSGAVLQADNITVRLTTTAQTPNQVYTVSCAAGNVLDLAGNANALTTANFSGYNAPGTMTVAQGADTGRPTAAFYAPVSADRVVDELALTVGGGTMTLNQIVVRGLDTVGTLQTDVSGVRLFRDNGTTVGQWDAGDTQLGTTQTFSGQPSGSTATFSTLGLAIASGTTEKVWVVYTTGASAVTGHIVGSQVNIGDVTATGGTVTQAANIVSAVTGQTIQIDATAPTADTTDPLTNAVLLGSSKTISGTASDTGSGVASVQLQILRSDAQYWNGTAWTGTATWLSATGTTNWTYAWALDAGQNNGPLTYTITARATDGVGLVGTDATPVTGVKVDNVLPSIVSATSVNATTADVVFSEALQAASIASTDFTIAGLTVSGAVLQADNITVRLTTTAQTPNQVYTVSCAAGNVLDLAGNANALATANFSGYAPLVMTVAQGTDPGRPTAKIFSGRSDNKVVDELALSVAGSGTMTLNQIVVRGLDTVGTLQTDVSGVRLFRDNGTTVGQWDAGDTQLGTTQTFSGQASGSTATFSTLGLAIASGTNVKVWIVYTTGAAAVEGHIVGSQVNIGDVTATGGTVTQAANIVSAVTGQTIQIDATAPTANTTDPLTNAVLLGSSKTISGTASDTGSGVASVQLQILRSDAQYWNGTAWTATATWLSATGTTNWTYAWALDAGQNNGPLTYTVTARATDGVGLVGTDATPVTGVKVDNVLPSIVSATAVNATTVDVVFSEALQAGSIASTDFTITGLSVTGATLQTTTTVRLTTTTQTAPSYTVSCAAGNVLDLAGNGNAAGSATFTGDVIPPSVPTGVTAAAGSSPVVSVVSWTASTDNVGGSGVAGYRIFRSVTATWDTGTWESIGTTTTVTFNDTTGVPGQDYWYKVSAYDVAGNESAMSATTSPAVAATWVRVPHDAYSSATSLCELCHVPHQAATAATLLRQTGATTPETGVCYACHDGSGANVNVKTGATNSFAPAPTTTSGHLMQPEDTTSDLTNACANCHRPHADWVSGNPLPKVTINGATVNGPDNSWCLACHNAANSWYGAGYPNAATPTVDATGFPVLGTFPTTSTPAPYIAYTDVTYNAHASIPASATVTREAGDCLYCHGSHRTNSAYDGVVARFQPPTVTNPADAAYSDYAALCFKCHGSNDYGFTPAATNIKQFVTSGGTRSGHRIVTSGGTYPVGAPLPCYECHNPHGSVRNNKRLLSDALGGSLETTTISNPLPADAAKTRQFCFTCHTTTGSSSSGSDGVAYGWNSVTGTYVPVGTEKVAGLSRGAAIPPAVGSNLLRLPAVRGHYRDDTATCYNCHGKSYGSSTANNVHNPSGGISTGGVACYDCHTTYQTYMEDNVGTKQGGAARLTVYHHVLGGTGSEGDVAPGPGNDAGYPTTAADGLRCVSCHADHDKFNATPGANLRKDSTTNAPVAIASTDYDPTFGGGGLCSGCHGIARTRTATNEPAAPSPTQVVSSTAFNPSAHQYKVTSDFGTGNTFQADCSKCHNDEQTKEFQTSTNKFGTHWSAERSLLTALGGTITDPMGETHCYGCHKGTGAGADGYGTQPDYGAGPVNMTAQARSVQAQFGLTGSKHPVVPVSGNSVDCASCHNPHGVTTTSKVSNPDDTYTLAAYGTDAEKATYCLRCHDGAAPTYTNNGTILVPYTVSIAAGDATLMNKSTNSACGHWTAGGAIGTGEEVACGECHDNHGSNTVKLLGVYDQASGTNRIQDPVALTWTTITANTNTVCTACHTSATGTTYTRLTNGYPNIGTWPGNAVYTAGGTGIHNVANVVWPGTTYAAGDCKNCHDVHGTANTYDELRGTFTNANFGTCFECHDGAPSTRNIKQYFPTTSGGAATQTAASNFGHKIQTSGGNLTVGNGLPCYDCHAVHGSAKADGLQVDTTIGGVHYILGDAASEIDMTTAAGVRLFCFTCHTGDTAAGNTAIQGTNSAGTGFTTIVATDLVEGISRTSYDSVAKTGLHLPALNGHYTTLGTQGSCYACHGNNYTGATTNNVHNPGPGVSTGGTDCYVCHGTYKRYMEDGIGTMTGDMRTTTYHHVMGSATNEGDKAFAAGSYPTSTTDVYCLSCHVDHDKFNATKASNLRPDISTVNPAGASADYSSTTNTGVCTACHATSLPKDTTNQLSSSVVSTADASTATPKIVPGGAANQFGASAHDYYATSSYDTSNFGANCSKCHNDEQTKEFQTSTVKFGTHWSAARRLLSALGGTITDPLQENHCYRCHSRIAPDDATLTGTRKTVATRDYYNATAMTAASERVYAQFSFSNVGASRHPVASADQSTGDAVECESCHNAHVVDTTTGKVTDPDNTYNTVAYATVANQVALCLKCHDGALPAYTVNSTTYIPYTVTQANATLNNKNDAALASKGHWSITGTTGGVTAPVSCAQCHDNHGSSAPKLLGAYDMTDSRNEINAVAVTANDNTVCMTCHSSATGTYTRLANGYPDAGTWPGNTVYTAATTGIHNVTNVVWPGTTYTAGDCKNCHDVHGTANTYDELRGTFTNASFGNCFACHDSDGPATAVRDIKRYYPTGNGGTATQDASSNFGHKIQSSGGTLTAGNGLPCYDCHNPHGTAVADGLLVMTMNNGVVTPIGDAAGEIDMSTAQGNRRFCFLCHTTGDAVAQGTNPAAPTSDTYINITTAAGTAVVEGISRTVYDATGKTGLKLPPVNGHYAADLTKSCYSCHGDSYTSATSVNVHNPGPGGSNGAIDCYGCHPTYQTYMEDGLLTKLGSSRTTTYHHVMGSATNEGDKAFAAGSYPTSTTDVYCLSCHVDHDKFNASKSANLRPDITTLNPTGASADYNSTSKTGVCTACHATSLTKDKTNQKSVASSDYTPAISANDYGLSAHNYTATSSYGDATTFGANCSKCHNDEQTKQYQTSTRKFGTHWSAERRILAAMGVAMPADPLEETECYKCHSLQTAGFKTTADVDWYGIATMNAASQNIYALRTSTFSHYVSSYTGIHQTAPADENRTDISTRANKHVECGDCHNVHAATKTRHTSLTAYQTATGNLVAGGALQGVDGATPTFSASNWTAPTAYTQQTATKEAEICFKCHSGYNTNVTGASTWGGTGAAAWTDQGLEFSTANASYHPVVAALPVANRLSANAMRAAGTAANGQTFGGWAPGDTMYCSDCHAQSSAGSLGPHGSAVKWMLKGPNQAWPYTTAAANGTSTGTYRTMSNRDLGLDTADGMFCRNCHTIKDTTQTNVAHGPTSWTTHDSYSCLVCHIRVPHGGKVSRLLCAVDNNTTSSGNMDPRYAANGNGTMISGHIRTVKKPIGESTCYDNCNHTAALTAPYETW